MSATFEDNRAGAATAVPTRPAPQPPHLRVTSLEDQRSSVDAQRSDRSGPYELGGKRLLDIVAAGGVLVVAAPALAVVAAAIRLRLGSGVLLGQERIGRNGESFRLLKFRTMHHSRRDLEPTDYVGPERRLEHKTLADPRHTPLGRILRRFSIDELPQLWNIVRGDMSIVGPRPELASLAAEDFIAHERHAVRPGLTGPFQISPLRATGDLRSGFELDASYAKSQTLFDDAKIVIKTVEAVRRGTGS